MYRMHKNGRMWKNTTRSRSADLLVWVTKGLSAVTTQMRREDLNVTGEINQLITKNLFTTITNANFDPEMITSQIEKTLQIKKVLLLQLKNPEKLPEAARWSQPLLNLQPKLPL